MQYNSVTRHLKPLRSIQHVKEAVDRAALFGTTVLVSIAYIGQEYCIHANFISD